MIKQFEHLTNEEQALLLRAPALVSVLASCSRNEINKASKADAVKLAHLRTYKAFPELLPYYAEVEKAFKAEFEAAVQKYAPFDAHQRELLQEELEYVNYVISKLDDSYAYALHRSLDKYSDHVKKAAHSVFEDFVFPFPLKGVKF